MIINAFIVIPRFLLTIYVCYMLHKITSAKQGLGQGLGLILLIWFFQNSVSP